MLLIRHSVPAVDPSRPSEEWPLSEEGRRRCEELAVRVGARRPVRLLSSPEPKALETAQLIAPALGLRVEVADDLRETARRTVGWLERDMLDERMRELFARPDDVVFGEESAAAAIERFSRVVESVREPAAFVTHGTVITLYACRTDPARSFAFWRALRLPDVVEV